MPLRPHASRSALRPVAVRCGARELPDFTARAPASGWTLDTLAAACIDYATEHHAEAKMSLSGTAQAAWLRVAPAALRKADRLARVTEGRDWRRMLDADSVRDVAHKAADEDDLPPF